VLTRDREFSDNPGSMSGPPTNADRAATGLAATDAGFRWRSREITRIEGFSDAVFAFAVTLLVVSLEVPQTFHELRQSMDGFVAFALGFALLFWIWFQQYLFFRRYGLSDGWTVTLNGALLFVVLFFVYPLKFLFVNLVRAIAGRSMQVVMPDGTLHPAIAPDEGGSLMMIYSSGYVAIFLVFWLLYRNALRQRAGLGLSPVEELITRAGAREQLINAGIGGLSLALAALGGAHGGALMGWVYLLVGPSLGLHGWLAGRARERLEARLTKGAQLS
jgi:hypothetical protein